MATHSLSAPPVSSYLIIALVLFASVCLLSAEPSVVPSCAPALLSTASSPSLSTPGAANAGVQTLAAVLSDARDLRVQPCDDFYHHACGGWINSTHMPLAELKRTRSFSTIKDTNQRTLQQIFDSNWPVLSPFYRSCTEQQRIDAVGLQPLAPLLDLFNDEANSSLSSLFHSLGVLSRQQLLHPIISLSVDVDPSSPSRQWLVLTQPSLSLPSLSLYSNSTLTSHLTSHIATLLRLTGLSPSRAAIHAERAVTIERLLSSISTPPSHLRNPLATFNPTNLSSLTTLAPHIPWPAFFAGLDLPLSSLSTPLNVAVPSYLSSLSSLISTRPDIVPLLSSYACYRVLHAFAADLPTPFQAANFDFFGAELRGQKQPEPRWSVCVDRTVQQLSELSGRYFMLERFTTQQREGVERVIAAIKEALRKQLTRAGWLDDGTRARALHKLASVIDNIGGATAASTPSYDAVPLHSDTYLANLLLLRAFNSNRTFTRLSFPTSRRLWQMAASESNAYYEPTTNSINFFAGILQPPFWDASAPAVVNLGGLGMVVGHELSHAFDDEGRHYDGIGALREWWGKGAQEGFAERAGCVQEGYGGMGVGTSEGWERVDGRLTLGENLADNAGLQLAWAVWEGGEVGKGDAGELMRTMRPPVESEAQLFFLSFASDWCQKVRPQFAHIALQTDVHSPAVARVNGVLMNMPQFSSAYHCPLGSPMNPPRKCALYT